MAGAVGTNKFGMDAEFFTRGQIGDVDTRGGSMVQKHLEKLQVEKENQALGKLTSMMPHLGAAVRVVALQETNWEVENAASMLDRFTADYDDELKVIVKRRKHIAELAEEAAAERQAKEKVPSSSSASESGSGSEGGSSSSDSESERDKKRRHKSSKGKDKDRKSRKKKESSKRRRDSSKGKDRSKDRKERRSKKDKDKRRKSGGGKEDKKASEKAGHLTHSEDFGKYGIIREGDATAKHSEFMLWALDVKKVNIETLPKPDERELFKDFMEDYNTGTLPHRKYYNVEAYQTYKDAKDASKGGKKSNVPQKKSALADEEDMQRMRAEEMAKIKEARLMEAYQQLKYTDKASNMREQELLRLKMQQAYKTGDKETAAKIQKRLEPEDESKKPRKK